MFYTLINKIVDGLANLDYKVENEIHVKTTGLSPLM
jgi:hypothetical protein